MDIDGAGITQVTAKILPGFRPLTKHAIVWRQAEDGNWLGVDRGAAEDIYETKISMHGTESVINTFITEMQYNRDGESNTLTLSDFFSTEHIFGENVDHSGNITATITGWPQRRQATLKGWSVTVTLRATSVSFTGASSLPTLQYCATGPEAYSDWTINKDFTYEGTAAYSDRQADTGIFQGVFTVTQADAILLRNYIRSQRTGNFTLANNFGIDYPFGPRSGNSYSYTTKLIDWEDMGLVGVNWHRFRLRFAEVV